MVRIIVTPVNSEDLQHGDLYSEHDQEWWDNRDNKSIGHFLILRNSNPFPEGYEGRLSYKVTVEPDDTPLQDDNPHAEEDPVAKYGGTDSQGEEGDDEVIVTG